MDLEKVIEAEKKKDDALNKLLHAIININEGDQNHFAQSAKRSYCMEMLRNYVISSQEYVKVKYE